MAGTAKKTTAAKSEKPAEEPKEPSVPDQEAPKPDSNPDPEPSPDATPGDEEPKPDEDGADEEPKDDSSEDSTEAKSPGQFRPVTASGLHSVPQDVLNPAFAAPRE